MVVADVAAGVVGVAAADVEDVERAVHRVDGGFELARAVLLGARGERVVEGRGGGRRDDAGQREGAGKRGHGRGGARGRRRDGPRARRRRRGGTRVRARRQAPTHGTTCTLPLKPWPVTDWVPARSVTACRPASTGVESVGEVARATRSAPIAMVTS